jgi:hypothetical protein
MHPEIRQTLQGIETADWKEIPVEYGREILNVRVPQNCTILTMKEIPILSDPRVAFEEALSRPIGSPTLEAIIRSKGKSSGPRSPSPISRAPFPTGGRTACSGRS